MPSFRQRQALFHLAVIVPVLGIGAICAYWGLSRAVHGQLDAALLALGETEVGMMVEHPDQAVRVHEAQPGPLPPSFDRLDRLVQVVDAQGTVLARSANLGTAHLPIAASLLARTRAGETVFETLRGYGVEPVRMVSVPVEVAGHTRVVQVAGSLDDVHRVVASAGVLFVALGVALMLGVGWAGALSARRAFSAIDDVVRQARRIGEAAFSERLPHPGTRDEVGRLVDTLNDMLDRLEHAFEAQRRFTADASHELRSPLSRLRTEIDVALRRPRDVADYVEALRSCLEEVERLTLLVEELLLLARLDAGQPPRVPETIALDRLVQEAVRRVQSSAEARGVELIVESAAAVAARIGRRSAELALANLLDNALKFTPPGGRVTVQLIAETNDAVVSVADSGPGMAAGELPHLFDRFFRGSAARVGRVPGVGLGLALSQAMVQAHGGRIDAANLAGGGALFTVRLPLATGAAAPDA